MGCSSSAVVAAPVQFEEKYSLGRELGHGQFGQVYEANMLKQQKAIDSARDVAVKVIHLLPPPCKQGEKFGSGSTMQAVGRMSRKVATELATWRHVGEHMHVVCLYEAFKGSTCAFFVMERCQCTVTYMLSDKPLNTVGRATSIMTQMLSGIAHVHSVGIVHQDVKPDNFLAGGPEGSIIKLCDFGLAAPLPQGDSSGNGKLGGTHGTPAFMSPEMLLGNGYDEKTDVWSFGSMCYFILFGCWAYCPKAHRVVEMKEAIRTGTLGPDYQCHGRCKTCVMEPFDVDRFKPFLKKALQRDPDVRPTAEAALVELREAYDCKDVDGTSFFSTTASTASPHRPF